jgi:ABC-2 type transport system permease protein
MDKILAVARREFLATVRTKAFILSVVLMPALIVGAILATHWVQKLAEGEKMPVRRIAVIDHSDKVYNDLRDQVDAFNTQRPNQRFDLEQVAPGEANEDALRARVNKGELYGYLILAADAVDADGGCVLARKDKQLEVGRELEERINNAVAAVRLRESAIDPTEIAKLRRRVPVSEVEAQTGKAVTSNVMAQLMTPFAFMFLMFMGTFGISQGLLTSLIEEKSNRVIEVLLSAVSPLQLMAGKILGTALVGFLLLTVWGTVGFGSAQQYHVADLVTGYRLTIAVLYFVPGFLLLSALLAAIGSACNELKDAQSMVFPLSLLTIIPMIFWFYISQNPASTISIALSYIPPIAPFIMILRICSDPDTPLWQIISTLALLWVSVVAAMWAAGKVFRVGVLMYGKPPSLRELARWVRYT